MIPVNCIVKHDPPHSYGDCVRACVASILEADAEDVPHFYADGNGEYAFDRLRDYLRSHGLIPAYFPIPGDQTLEQALGFMNVNYPETEYLLFCADRGGDHCVAGCGGEIIHNPAWYRTEIIGPHSSGVWIVIILANLP